MLDNYINELVERMLDDSDYKLIVPYNSSLTISFKAYREAETISDYNYIDNIIENIASEKNKKRRDKLYFIVGAICEKKHYQRGLEFLIDRLEMEIDKYILSAMLDKIMWLHKSAETDLSKIIKCLNHKTWQVRYSAINALQNTKNNIVDDLMIQILENENATKHEISYAMVVMYNCGGIKCIPSLEKQTHNKSRIIQAEAKATLQTLMENYKINQ